MELGLAALVFGLAVIAIFELTPRAWLRVAGGLLVLLTIAIMVLQILGVPI